MTGSAGRFAVERRTGSAATLHGAWPPGDPGTPRIAVCRVTAAAVVLGSAQHVDAVDAGAAARCGASVVVRRTGGGAVWVAPGEQAWVDMWLPRGDARWVDDVVVSSAWIGAAWRRALASLGAAGLAVVDRPRPRDTWSAAVCFAGLAPGETHAGGRKVTGVAQRRTADGAWFHTVAYLRWAPEALVECLALGPEDRRRLGAALAGAAVGIEELLAAPAAGVLLDTLEAAVVGAIGASGGEAP